MAEPIRVLHVDDDPEFAELASTFLERENDLLTVERETDPRAALDRLGEHEGDREIDSVVSDYDMPRIDGIELLDRVRERDETLPFILFTGKGSEEVASEALSKGATDYLQKGSGRDQYALLANRIENAVDQRRSTAALERKDEILSEAQSIANIGVIEFDVSTGETWLSDGIYNLYDVDRTHGSGPVADLDLDAVIEHYHPDDRAVVEAAVDRMAESSETVEFEARLDTDDRRWVSTRCKPLSEDGDLNRIRATVQEITARKAREREMESRERIMERLGLSVYALDADGNPTYVNPAIERLSGYDVERILAEDSELLYSEADIEAFEAAIRELITEEPAGVRTVEATLHTADGGTTPVEVHLTLLTDEHDTFAGTVGVTREISDRRQTEQQLREYESLVRALPDEVAVLDNEGNIMRVIPPTGSETAIGGHDPADLEGEYVSSVLTDESVERSGAAIEELLSTDRERTTVEVEIATTDDGTLIRENHVALLEDEDGNTRGSVGILRDIEERKAREHKLERYETLLEVMPDPVVVTDDEATITDIYGFEGWSGNDYDETVGTYFGDAITDESAERAVEATLDLLESEDSTKDTFEIEIEPDDGEPVPFEDHLALLPPDEDGGFVGTMSVLRNITERKERERELERYETIVRAIPDEIYTTDAQARLTSVIPPTGSEQTTTRYDSEELAGEHVSTVLDDEAIERGNELIQRLLENDDLERVSYEMNVVTKDGERIPNENHISLLPRGEDDEFRGTVGVLRNIADRKERERELQRQNERLERFASIASHDLRNPLNLAQGYVDVVDQECDSEHTETIADALDRMEQLIEDTMTWARQGATVDERRPIDLQAITAECWGAVGSNAGTVDVVDDVTVRGDPDRVRRVVENLLRNAVEHGGDDVGVEIGPIAAEDGGRRGFYVADDGPGVPADERDSVFDTGFTTAADGTGFGLAIISEICDAHGWDVAVTESEAGGARFEITGVERAD